ncbi:MAG: hypothetical protein SF182_20245 [Deltaproteobacteria bacterium]|nr:hypothetical protein [Deltaproteobacteria bacterium]
MNPWLLAAWLVAASPTMAPPVPAEVTICVDRAAQRCWTAAGRDACVGGEVFRVVSALDEPEDQLQACRAALR